MTDDTTRVVSATRDIDATAAVIFELIADPARQPEWDGNDNLDTSEPGQRVRAEGDAFITRTTKGNVRQNNVVEFDEGRRIAWMPGEVDAPRPGHLWRWELEPLSETRTRVTHTYDWTQLTDERRFDRARWTTAERLMASMDRLAALAERER